MRYEKDIPFRSVSFGLFYPAKNGVTRDFAKLALKMSTPLRRYPTPFEPFRPFDGVETNRPAYKIFYRSKLSNISLKNQTMDNSFETLLEHSKQAIRYWWLLLLTGIALFIIGLVVFLYPAQSYLGMSLMFGFLIFFSGLFQIILSAGNKHYMTGRGWMLAGGIIEVILGVILILNTALSAATLPIFLAFWLLFRSFSAIGLGSDMNAMNIPGSGWTIVSGVLLLLLSMWILFQPILFGTAAVIIWVGISLLFAGMSACIFAFQLRDVHKHMK